MAQAVLGKPITEQKEIVKQREQERIEEIAKPIELEKTDDDKWEARVLKELGLEKDEFTEDSKGNPTQHLIVTDTPTQEIRDFIYERLKARENWEICFVSYHRNISEEYIGTDFSEEGFFGEVDSFGEKHSGGGSYGGGMTYTKDELKDFVDEMRDWITRNKAQPLFVGRSGFRQVKDENIRIFFIRQAREFLERNGVNVEGLLNELSQIKGRVATVDNIRQQDRHEFVERETKRVEKKLEDLEDVVERGWLGKSEYYERNKPYVIPIEYEDKEPNEIVELIKKTRTELQQLKNEENEYWEAYRNNGGSVWV